MADTTKTIADLAIAARIAETDRDMLERRWLEATARCNQAMDQLREAVDEERLRRAQGKD